jgi:hypothetical protein
MDSGKIHFYRYRLAKYVVLQDYASVQYVVTSCLTMTPNLQRANMSNDTKNEYINDSKNTYLSLWLRSEPITIAILTFGWNFIFYVTAIIYVIINFILERCLVNKSTKYKMIMLIWTGIVCGVVVMIINIITSVICTHKKFPYFDAETYYNILVYYTFFFSIILIGRLTTVILDRIIEKQRK